jgi:hypothetical protein
MAVYVLDVDTNIKGEFSPVAPELTDALQTAFSEKRDVLKILERSHLDQLVRANQLETDLNSILHGGAVSAQFVRLIHADGFLRSELVDGPDGVVLTVTLVDLNSEILWQGQAIESRASWLLHDIQRKDAARLADQIEVRLSPSHSGLNRPPNSGSVSVGELSAKQGPAETNPQHNSIIGPANAFETADYRLSVGELRMDGNRVTVSIIADSLSEKAFRLTARWGTCYVLDENGGRWNQESIDSAGFTGSGFEIQPGTRVKSDFTFVTTDIDSGSLFTFMCKEFGPVPDRQIIIRGIPSNMPHSVIQPPVSATAQAIQKAAVPGIFETADYQLSTSAFRKDGNRITVSFVACSLSEKPFRLTMRWGTCYFLDENGGRWTQQSIDSASFTGNGFEIEPGTRVKSDFTFAATDNDIGSLYTFICKEYSPVPDRQIIIRGITGR